VNGKDHLNKQHKMAHAVWRHFSVISAQLPFYSNQMFPSLLIYCKLQWRILLLKLSCRNSELSVAANCHGLCVIWWCLPYNSADLTWYCDAICFLSHMLAGKVSWHY